MCRQKLVANEKTYLFGCVYDCIAASLIRLANTYLLRSLSSLGLPLLRMTDNSKETDSIQAELKTGQNLHLVRQFDDVV